LSPVLIVETNEFNNLKNVTHEDVIQSPECVFIIFMVLVELAIPY